MSETYSKKEKSCRDMIYFPIVYNIVGLLAASALYAVSPEHLVEPQILNTVLYLGVIVTHWALFFVIAKRLGMTGIKKLILPKKKTRWLPSILIFALLNVLFTTYMILALIYGRILPWGNVNALQFVFYVILSPMTAGFVEELIWRGYFIEKLLASGKIAWKAIIYSSISFAFIHGFIVVDKLVVAFIFGVIAGAYYVKERNILVLIATHVVVDIIAFWLTLFRPI